MPSFIFQCLLRLSQWVHRKLLPEQRYSYNTHNKTPGGPGNIHVVVSYLQTVVQPVRMEEYVVVHLPMLTVTVPVGTQETTARTEV